MTIDVGTVYVIMNNFSYDPVDVPTLPEDALFAVFLETFNQDLGDGSYVILDGGDAVRITAPDGWTLATLDQTSLSFMKDDGSQIASFNLFYAFTATDLTFSMNTSVLESFKQTGFYSSHGFSTFETANDAAWFQFTDGSSAYYTWFPVGENSFLLVESIDASGLELIEALEPLVELTEAYDLDF
ncbi:MAG: hypothetical protein II280_05780 [Lachnospiraceae bacterium]|nr:hypothetical protein [Lachnospiraceae bacterium]